MDQEYYAYMLSVLDKAEKGPFIEESEFDKLFINKKINELIRKFDIGWSKETAVTNDDALADRVFAAGFELALDTGLYCLDTRRRMVWSRDELEWLLGRTPLSVTIGEGKDTVRISKRRPDEHSRVAVVGGAYGTQVPEELFVPIMLSYAQEPEIDFIDNASLVSTHGRPIRVGSPWEAVGCWQEAIYSFEVVKRAGRPGMPIGCAENSPSMVGELATTTYGGFRQTDWHHASFISELKTSYAELTKAIHYVHTGSFSHNFYNPIYGGFVGGGPGMAIAIVAGMMLIKAAYGGVTSNPGPSHAHLSCDTYPDMVTSQALAFQGLNRNTNLLTSSFVRPVGGPGTKDILYEAAALTIASVPSGIALMEGVQSAMGRFTAHVSGLEAKFTARVAHAAEQLSRTEANEIVGKLFEKYRANQKSQPVGKPFNEVYNVETIKPTTEWQRAYNEVCLEIKEEFGLDL